MAVGLVVTEGFKEWVRVPVREEKSLGECISM
jgi:hypothetical protein